MYFPRAARGKRIFFTDKPIPAVDMMENILRISKQELKKRRREKSGQIFLTGGTGFLGCHLAVELLRKGYQVCLLVRSNKHISAKARVKKLLDWFDLPDRLYRRIRIIEGDISRTNLGIEPVVWADLLKNTDEIVHCASNTSFSERKKAEVEAINIKGLANVLSFSRASRAYCFHHVSTAYVAGKSSGLCPEELVVNDTFNNTYEKTKCQGEHMAWEICRTEGLRLTIYRPSIVYGHSRTGRSLIFNALYYPVRMALFLRNLYENDILERGGKKAETMGVQIETDGSIRLPLRIEVHKQGGINLIPVDYFIDAFIALMEEALDGGVFHIVNQKSKKIEDIIEYSSRLFRMTGIRACQAEDFKRVPKNALELLFDHYLETYNPYMRDTRIFEMEKCEPILRKRGIACPDFDYDIFARCMNFAVEVNWGSRLFAPGS